MDKIDETILKLIEKDYISGEKLSSILKISRTAVWKRIKKLEKIGYIIEHSPKGYKLVKSTEHLVLYELKKYLKTYWLGENYIFFEEINSTNVYAKEKNLPHGTVVLAENQTAGKGRKGRKWISQKGKGLYFSIVLKETLPINDFLIYSLLFPAVIKRTLEDFIFQKIYIKWPNDLYINNKKFAGFLIESEIEGNEISKIVVGIGINVNNTEESFKSIDRPATSLLIEEKRELPRKEIFAKILENLEACLDDVKPEKILKTVEDALLWKGENVYLPEIDLEGVLLGLNKEGGLLLDTEKGIKTIYSGDLTLRHR